MVRLQRGGNWRRIGPTLEAAANRPVLTQASELSGRKKASAAGGAARLAAAVSTVIKTLSSIRFLDFSPDLMRRPSMPGQIVLSDRGENLSSVLQAICEDSQWKEAL